MLAFPTQLTTCSITCKVYNVPILVQPCELWGAARAVPWPQTTRRFTWTWRLPGRLKPVASRSCICSCGCVMSQIGRCQVDMATDDRWFWSTPLSPLSYISACFCTFKRLTDVSPGLRMIKTSSSYHGCSIFRMDQTSPSRSFSDHRLSVSEISATKVLTVREACN